MSTLSVDEERWTRELAAARASLHPGSTVERAAETLRTLVTNGMVKPGSQLREKRLVTDLQVSRNTLREAFRLLSHERLVEYKFSRGVFVRKPTSEDVRDLYRVRRILETAAIRCGANVPTPAVRAARAAVEEGERAAAEDSWFEVGTANMHFHQAIAGLAGSDRIDESVRRLLAEMRLVFHVMEKPREFHEPYLKANRNTVELLEEGDVGAAEGVMLEYLDRAERQLLDAYANLEQD